MTGKFYALDYEFNTGEMNKVVALVSDFNKADELARHYSRSPDCFRVALYCLDVFDDCTLSSKLVNQYSSGYELSEALKIANRKIELKNKQIFVEQTLF